MWKRRSKYGAKKTVRDGITFHSKKEADRYSDLRLLERSGEITRLELQPRFTLTVNGQKICDYVADFGYKERGVLIVEDVKGDKKSAAYRLFRLKSKLMKAVLGITVLET